MEKHVECLLDPSNTFTSMKWNLEKIQKIEHHIKMDTSCQHPPLEELVVTCILHEHERSTPLLMACQHGDLKAVKRIVEDWSVNVSTAAVHSAEWPGSRLEGATPLFVAALYCHSNIVRYLIEKGADVNFRTHSKDKKYSGLTPLHAAIVFYEDSVDAEEKISTIRILLESGADPSLLTDDGVPIWRHISSSSGSSQITTLLVEWGMDLNQRAPDSGITVLHFWAEQVAENPDEDESLGVVRMLLEKGANSQDRDYDGFSVILAAANGGDRFPNLPVLDYLLDRGDIPRQDKIDALEFAGAVILANEENHEKFPLAFQLWRRALTLRRDTEDPLHKMPLKSKSGQLSEWMTLDDIQRIEQLPAQREIQSLLVRLRIFAGLSQRAMEYYMKKVLIYLKRGVDNDRTFGQMIDLSLMALDVIFRLDPIESKLRFSTIDVIGELIFIFRDLPNEDPNFNSSTLKALVELVAKMDQLHLPDANQKMVADTTHIRNLKNLVSILASRPDLFIDEEMKENLVHLVRRDVRDSDGFNVLLIACSNPDVETLSIVRLLLELEVDVNAVNNVGDGPLHLLAVVRPDTETRDAIAILLLESGAHLDMVNKETYWAADLWMLKKIEDGKDVDVSDLPDWLKGGVPSLKCLCSRVIHFDRIPYNDEAILPAVLIPFVALHGEWKDVQEVEDAELDEPNSKKDELKLSSEVDQLHLPDANQKIVADTNHIENLKSSSDLAATFKKSGEMKEDSQEVENSEELEDSQEVEDAELDEPSSKKDELKLSPKVERDSFDEIEDSNNKMLSCKLTFGASKKVDESESGAELDEFDMEFENATPLREKTNRAAAAKMVIKVDSDSDDSVGGGGAAGDNSTNEFVVSDSDEEFSRSKKAPATKTKATKHAISSDDDDGGPTDAKKIRKAATAPPPPPVNKVSSEDLFDPLIGAFSKKDPPPPKRATYPAAFAIDSDSDASFEASKPNPKPK